VLVLWSIVGLVFKFKDFARSSRLYLIIIHKNESWQATMIVQIIFKNFKTILSKAGDAIRPIASYVSNKFSIQIKFSGCPLNKQIPHTVDSDMNGSLCVGC
jgi:hypothetical protein